jgi:hypothetical protein
MSRRLFVLASSIAAVGATTIFPAVIATPMWAG